MYLWSLSSQNTDNIPHYIGHQCNLKTRETCILYVQLIACKVPNELIDRATQDIFTRKQQWIPVYSFSHFAPDHQCSVCSS